MFCSICPGIEFSFYRCIREQVGIRNEAVDCNDTLVEIILDLVEVTVVRVRDLGRNISLRDPVNILGSYIERSDYSIKGSVNPFNDLPEISLMFCSICPGIEFSVYRGIREKICVGNEETDCNDTLVEIILDLVEVTVVRVRDLRRNIPFRDPVDILGSYIERSDYGIKGSVNPFNDLPEVSLMFCSICPGIEFSFYRCIREQVGIRNEAVDCNDTLVEIILDLVEVTVVRVRDLGRNISLRDPVNILGSYIERSDYSIKGSVNPFNDLPEISLMFCSICPGIRVFRLPLHLITGSRQIQGC